MIVTAHGPEVTVPTPVQYHNHRLTAPSFQRDFPDDAPHAEVSAWLQDRAAWQEAWLLRRENEVRASYGMAPRKVHSDSSSGAAAPPIAGMPTGQPFNATRLLAQKPVGEVVAPAAKTEVPTVATAVAIDAGAFFCANTKNHQGRIQIPKPVAEYSYAKWGRHLCRPCQPQRRQT